MVTILLRVAEIRNETSDTITLCFNQPGLKKVKYLAGQYIALIFRINGRKYVRAYSLSSAPDIDKFIEVTVKRMVNGIVSNHINDKVCVGDMIEVMIPAMGDFIYTPELNPQNQPIFLWGVGSGITPLVSIAKYVLKNYLENSIILIYGNRTQDNIIFKNVLRELEERYKERFKVWYFHTRIAIEQQGPYLIQGRIEPKKILSVLQDKFSANSLHYICGPLGLKESVKLQLKSLNVSPDRIFTEEFEIVKDPKDFENIQTQVIEISLVGDSTHKVEVIKGKSILEAGLDALIDIPYSCQTGNCLVCKGKLLSGQVKTIGSGKRSEKLEENEYLLCCSYPLTENVRFLV